MAKKSVPGQLGLFKPESDWVRPTELPDLRRRGIMAVDTETKDGGLARNKGPGWALGPDGYICGVCYAAPNGSGGYEKGYIPMAHPESDNFQPDQVFRWIDDHFERDDLRVVFHNGPYDLGWLGAFGVRDPVHIEDTSAAAVMLDENHRRYSLDACCARAGVPGKNTQMLRDAVRAYGGDESNPAADIWRLPAKYAGIYGEDDAEATLRLWFQLEPQLHAQGVWEAYRLDMDLIPVVVAMRRRGIRVNLDRAESVREAFYMRRGILLREITRGLQGQIRRAVTMEDVNSPQWLATYFANEQIQFPRTGKTQQGSFSKDWMEKHPHWLPRMIVEAREFQNAGSKFVDNFVLSYAHRSRIHAEVHQFLTDDGGTRSQRLSYSNPALQQMPSIEEGANDEPIPAGEHPWEFFGGMGGAIRSLFEPEKGEVWGAFDYSQQEPRITVHFASVCNIAGSEIAVETYRNNPRQDYHQMVADMVGMKRKPAKILNLAMTYGKGKYATAQELGVSLEEAEGIINQYHGRLTYIKPLDELCKNRAAARGFIRLIDGARMHYNLWEGGWISNEDRNTAIRMGKRLDACTLEEAQERSRDREHPWSKTRLRRADTRKALNNLVQGSAARQTKRAMLECYRAGYLPLIQMHDELGHSVSSDKMLRDVHDIMRDAIPLRVPVVVDCELGDDWGTAKHKILHSEYLAKFRSAA